ncbi:hypothetical protein HX096_12020 [Empedobacter falsenii]|uniref:hypothetical protein n=1 Tax=Empedobacter falsenii TaxID=343874 RepID=UPI002574ED2D|nr:hypothetical protein [Empedobacter falsenii]MDM1548579.1 hypothetical protein [Empedobacter falsenii]
MLENEKIWILQNILSNVEEHNSAKLLRESLFKVIDGFAPLITASGAGVYTDALTPSSEVPTDVGDKVFLVTEPGTYTNFGNVVLPENNFGFIFKNGNSFSLQSVEMPMQDLTELEQNTLTYKTSFDAVTTNAWKSLIKNIYIDSSYQIKKVSYIGINDQDNRRLLIQIINQNDEPGSFYLMLDDLRALKNQTVELVSKNDNVLFIENTRVWIEFQNVDFPLKSEVSFLQSFEPLKLLKSCFKNPIKEKETILLNKDGVNDVNTIRFISLVKNIYIVDLDGEVSIDNINLSTIIINQYEGERKLIFQFKVGEGYHNFYTKKDIVSGSERVRLEFKETSFKNCEVYLDFHDFETFPTDTFTLSFLGARFQLTNEAFANYELITAQKLEKVSENVPNTNINVVKADKSQGNNAVQLAINSIKDASASNRYCIEVANGLYEIHHKNDFIGNPGYPAMICPIDHVDIKGESRTSTILSADFDDSPNDDTWLYQVIYNWANDVTISNLTLIAKNLRYVLHQDNGNEAFKTRYYENVDFIFKGNKGSYRALGTGTFSGSKTYVTGGSSQSQIHGTFAVHNNVNFSVPSLWSFKNHSFTLLDGKDLIYIQNCGSNVEDEVIFENCSFSGGFIVDYQEYWLYNFNINDHFNHANWRVRGANNAPFYFQNGTQGKHLAIETISKTKESKVRFDINSSAYPLIIANRVDYFGHLGNPNRKIKDKYVIQDGSIGLSAFAFGCVSIIEGNYPKWGEVSQDSLGKRLSDCSTVNKILGIIINDTTYNVVFNKNYTAFTNAQVIAEINAVIGSVGIAKESNIGADYYAEMTDVVAIEINNSTSTMIPKGTLVTKIGSRIAPCGENDVLYGLLIDDLGAYELDSQGVVTSKARVIRNCYVSVDSGNVSSVLHDSVGSRYKISNGRFVADSNGKYNAIDNKYILI